MTIKLSRALRARAAHTARMTLSLTVTGVDTAGNRGTLSKTIRLRR